MDVRPLIKSLKGKFKATVAEETGLLAADKQIVPFKGKLKTYNPKKPNKWGYKIYVLASAQGLILYKEFSTGQIDPMEGQPDLKASGNIVLPLLQPIPHGQWHKPFTDNWFTSPALFTTLHSQHTGCEGMVRANRLLGCALP
ncbi:uncharacterized protein LOC101860488 [Aplysia californica]|uniref:Uncharacterized protein LOC101860488 n=1 Tax=Aplysia californica TaxID=6500 RepID=A0ABM0JIH0_APLCA|nr:uncharacterized protein LOC101860488 [Aplysia californica]